MCPQISSTLVSLQYPPLPQCHHPGAVVGWILSSLMLSVDTVFPRPKHISSSPIGLDLVFCGFWMSSHSSVLAGWGWAHVCAVNPNHLYKTLALTSTLASVTPATFCHTSLLDPPLIELKSQSPHDGDPVSGLTSCAIFPHFETDYFFAPRN